jgi:hypothetical protein
MQTARSAMATAFLIRVMTMSVMTMSEHGDDHISDDH